MPPERKQESVTSRSCDSVRDFFRALLATENRHRTLLITFVTCPPTLILLGWWLYEIKDSPSTSNPSNSNAFAVFSMFVSAIGALLAAIVLFKLQEIKTPDAFLRRLIDMLDDAQSGNEFIYVAPSFNVQSLPKEDLHEIYCEAFERAIKKGVKVTLCYCENTIDPTAFLGLSNQDSEAALKAKQGMIDKTPQCEFVKWTGEVLDEDNWRKRDHYFTNCFSFLQRLRQAGLADEKVYGSGLREDNTCAVFVGNMDNRDFLFGAFTINPGAPQLRRVTCKGEIVRSNSRNKFLEETLLALVRQHVGNTNQPNLPLARAIPAATSKSP